MTVSKDPWLLGYHLELKLLQLLVGETGEVFCNRPACDMRLRVAKRGIAALGGVLRRVQIRVLGSSSKPLSLCGH